MAALQLQQTENEVRQKAQKAFREVAETQQARNIAQEMLDLRTEAERKAGTPAAMMAAARPACWRKWTSSKRISPTVRLTSN